MKSLFLKELRQGRLLVLFGLALGLLTPALYAVSLRRHNSLPAVLVDELRANFALGLLCLPPLIALFAGAGLFASEAERGTLPLLFSLPISRRRIWLAKVLAGLALTAIASALLLVVGNLLLPNPGKHTPFAAPAFLPDVCLWALFVFAAAVFASTLTSHTVAAVVLALVLGAGFVFSVLLVTLGQGALLLGYDELLDYALWLSAISLPLLLASAVAVSRGELLHSARRHLLALLTFAITLTIVVSLLIGIARFAFRYQRHHVARIEMLLPPDGVSLGPAIPVIAYADPTPYRRTTKRGWLRAGLPAKGHLPYEEEPIYRSVYAAILDTRTGRELDLLRLPANSYCSAGISPDGRYAALAYHPAGLTWGPDHLRGQTLRLLDLRQNNVLYQGSRLEPIRPWSRQGPLLEVLWAGLDRFEWSPTSSYLALSVPERVDHRPTSLHVVNPDGSGPRLIAEQAADWAWSPNEGMLYVLGEDMSVKRFRADGAGGQTIWTPAPGDAYTRRTLLASGLSPDGRWLLLSEEQVTNVPTRTGTAVALKRATLRAVATDGSHSQVIWSSQEPRRTARLAWSADSAYLYFAVWENHPSRARLLRWRPGDQLPTPVFPNLPYNTVWLLPVPDSDKILLWARLQAEWPRDQEIYTAEAFILNSAGEKQPLLTPGPASAFARENLPRGFDAQGRLLYQPNDCRSLNALDITTGRAEQIYP